MDIEDNADAIRIRDSLSLIQSELHILLSELVNQIKRFVEVPAMAYTHLQPAEPTTVGHRLAQYAQDLWMDMESVVSTRKSIRGKGLKGAVGTSASYSRLLHGTNWSPRDLEEAFMRRLDMVPFPVATQVYPRKQDLSVLNTLASLAASLHKMAFDLRVLQSPPFGEMAEPFGSKQVGSSAMPFKRNPINSEKVCSLTRYVGTLPSVAWQNAANCLLERTLDDSANRRVIMANAFIATDEALHTQSRIVQGWQVQTAGIERNLSNYSVFACTETLLMELVKAGGDRQALHEVIRKHSQTAWGAVQQGESNPLASLLSSDSSVTSLLPAADVRRILDTPAYVGDSVDRSLNFAAALEMRLVEIAEEATRLKEVGTQ